MSEKTSGSTSWGKFALLAVPAIFIGSAMAGLTATGAMASSFAVSGDSFKVQADRLEGDGFAQYGDVVFDIEDEDHGVAPAGIQEARLFNMCQSAVYDTPIGEFTVRVTAGTEEDNPVTATNLIVDTNDIQGDASFSNIEIGRDASTLDQVSDHQGAAGSFGQQSDTIAIDGLRQETWGITAGRFNFENLHVSVTRGTEEECY